MTNLEYCFTEENHSTSIHKLQMLHARGGARGYKVGRERMDVIVWKGRGGGEGKGRGEGERGGGRGWFICFAYILVVKKRYLNI